MAELTTEEVAKAVLTIYHDKAKEFPSNKVQYFTTILNKPWIQLPAIQERFHASGLRVSFKEIEDGPPNLFQLKVWKHDDFLINFNKSEFLTAREEAERPYNVGDYSDDDVIIEAHEYTRKILAKIKNQPTAAEWFFRIASEKTANFVKHNLELFSFTVDISRRVIDSREGLFQGRIEHGYVLRIRYEDDL